MTTKTKHYTVYLITNKITGEKYVGQHQTNNLNDGYIGSGRLLKQKIREYGVENFNKQILADFDSFEQMNQAEIDYIGKYKPQYNLSLGGESFEGVNSVPGLNNKAGQYHRAHERHLWLMKNDAVYRERVCQSISQGIRRTFRRGRKSPAVGNRYWLGRVHTEKTKQKISEAKRGKQTTSTLGQHWFTNGTENIIAFECPQGFRRGRTMHYGE